MAPSTHPDHDSQSPEELFGLLADRTRLRLLSLLSAANAGNSELCVGDLVAALEVPQPTASRHLARLRRAGWVIARRRDAWVFYSLAGGALEGRLPAFLEVCRGEDFTADRQRLKAIETSGGCCPP
jgi:ArsR family transcriptional regulator, arsenate/arsenite/antimonite-responsive transcriptional repressor